MRRGSSRRRTWPPMKLVVGMDCSSSAHRMALSTRRGRYDIQIDSSWATGSPVYRPICRSKDLLLRWYTAKGRHFMATHPFFRYSMWDGSQTVPNFTADELLETMADDLLRGGDPERSLRSMMNRGFRLPDGRRFEGMRRLQQQMREYRQEVFSRYDPNGLVDQIRGELNKILAMEREEIAERHEKADGHDQSQGEPGSDVPSPPSPLSQSERGGESESKHQPPSAQAGREGESWSNRLSSASQSGSGGETQSGQQSPLSQSGGGVGGEGTSSTEGSQDPSGEFRKMLDR